MLSLSLVTYYDMYHSQCPLNTENIQNTSKKTWKQIIITGAKKIIVNVGVI